MHLPMQATGGERPSLTAKNGYRAFPGGVARKP